jgi:hypothetical protein
MKILRDAKANLEIPNNKGIIPVIATAAKGHIGILQLLLKMEFPDPLWLVCLLIILCQSK